MRFSPFLNSVIFFSLSKRRSVSVCLNPGCLGRTNSSCKQLSSSVCIEARPEDLLSFQNFFMHPSRESRIGRIFGDEVEEDGDSSAISLTAAYLPALR